MKKFLPLLVFYTLIVFPLMSQNQGYMKETFNSMDFPEVSFIWHDDGAAVLKEKDVRYIKENGLQRDFTMVNQVRLASNEGKHIVILWEDFKELSKGKDIRTGQHGFIQKTIGMFLSSGKLGNNDNLLVSEFHRSTNTPTVMRPLTTDFSNDFDFVKSLVEKHVHSDRNFENAPNCTDLYTAVREAVELLRSLPEADESKAVYVFTAGHPRNVPGADSADQVLMLAQSLNIPIYVLQYAPRSGVALETENFAKATKGDFRCFMVDEERSACDFMVDSYDKIDDAYFGHDYKFTYVSNMKRGDDPQTVAINIKGVEYQEQYLPPAFSLKDWIMEHLLIAILILLLIIAAIVLAIVLGVSAHRKKTRKLKELEQQQRLSEAEAQKAIAEANESLDEYKRQQEKERIFDHERAEQERLAALMATKNIFPRLICEMDGKKTVYDMTQPRVTIGRETDNDLKFNHKSVSRHHAKISYDGYGFYITDMGSTNHVLVNGAVQSHSMLRSSDVIQLGQVKIVFYL